MEMDSITGNPISESAPGHKISIMLAVGEQEKHPDIRGCAGIGTFASGCPQ